MLTYVRNLTDERDSLTASANAIIERAATESRDVTDTEQASLASMHSRCAEIDSQLTTFGAEMDAQRSYAALRDRVTSHDDPPSSPVPGGLSSRAPEQSHSWGDLFTESDAFRNYHGRGSSDEVVVPGLFSRAPGDPIMVSTFPGQVPPYRFTPSPWSMTTPLLDAIGRVTTSSGTVEWYTWPGSFPVAAVVAEGAVKPGTDIQPTPHTASLVTYAHWQALSRQALEDIPMIQSIIEGALRGGVLAALEAAVAAALAAAGSGIPSSSNADLLAGIRVAIGNVQTRGYAQPNAVLLNPADFAELDMSVMGVTTNGPVRQGSVWGVRAIAVGAIPQGTAYVGDMATAVTLFSRDTVSVFMTDSHADYFIKNLLIILAEQRALPAVTQPNAAEKVTVTDPGTAQAAAK